MMSIHYIHFFKANSDIAQLLKVIYYNLIVYFDVPILKTHVKTSECNITIAPN
jgi:hypothetical protein